MATNEVRVTRTGNRRPVWPFIITAVLLLILLVVVGRSCRKDYGEVPPVISDTLDTDTMAVPPVYQGTDANPGVPADTGPEEPEAITPGVAPQGMGGVPATPAMP